MKCENCKYLGKEKFENTILRTCKLHYIIIQALKYLDPNNKYYSTDALKSPNEECTIIKLLK